MARSINLTDSYGNGLKSGLMELKISTEPPTTNNAKKEYIPLKNIKNLMIEIYQRACMTAKTITDYIRFV